MKQIIGVGVFFSSISLLNAMESNFLERSRGFCFFTKQFSSGITTQEKYSLHTWLTNPDCLEAFRIWFEKNIGAAYSYASSYKRGEQHLWQIELSITYMKNLGKELLLAWDGNPAYGRGSVKYIQEAIDPKNFNEKAFPHHFARISIGNKAPIYYFLNDFHVYIHEQLEQSEWWISYWKKFVALSSYKNLNQAAHNIYFDVSKNSNIKTCCWGLLNAYGSPTYRYVLYCDDGSSQEYDVHDPMRFHYKLSKKGKKIVLITSCGALGIAWYSGLFDKLLTAPC